MIEADLVDCMVALPGQLFYSTQIPACLWFLARDCCDGKFRDRCGEVLFIDARKLGRMVDRTHRELTDKDIGRITGTYHAWRSDSAFPSRDSQGEDDSPLSVGEGQGEGVAVYRDIPGFFAKSTPVWKQITPSRRSVPHSVHADRFVLKSALMLQVWRSPRIRPTMDIDLLGRASNAEADLVPQVRDILAVDAEPEGDSAVLWNEWDSSRRMGVNALKTSLSGTTFVRTMLDDRQPSTCRCSGSCMPGFIHI